MSTVESPRPSGPVGHQGARVEIAQRPAFAVNGWFGVRGARGLRVRRGTSPAARPRAALAAARCVFVAGRHLAGGRAARADLGGPVLRQLRRHGAPPGLLVGAAADGAPQGQRAGPQLRDQPPQGQRRRRQPGRDRGDRGLAGRRHRASRRTPSTTTRTSSRCRPSRPCATSPPATPTTTPAAREPRCAGRPTSSPASSPTRSPSGSPIAGVEVVEVRISHLAYAQEIAQAMLRRQQANAVVAARSRIVEGAVGMVEMALNRLAEQRAWSSSTRSARPAWSAT